MPFLILYLIITYPLRWLPYKALHALGRGLGTLLYYLYPRYRKRALSNLALASHLHLSEPDIIRLAKESIQNLTITMLEYPKLASEKNISHIASCENPQEAAALISSGQGVIFFVGHQANWELLFLEGTSRMPGVAIGRPIKNKYLYRWVVSIREKFGGKIIAPSGALREGLKALKSGKFLGIVGDQGMPDSGFSSPFLGRNVWTSPLPALLSIRTGCPIIVATIHRESGKYTIHYSDPIWPEGHNTTSLMHQVLSLFEDSIMQHPGQWLWVHNRFKQQLPGKLPRKLRHDTIAFIFSDQNLETLPEIRALYPTEFLTLFIPEGATCSLPNIEVNLYHAISDILIRDYSFKLIIDFTGSKQIARHFKRLGASEVLHFENPSAFLAFAKGGAVK